MARIHDPKKGPSARLRPSRKHSSAGYAASEFPTGRGLGPVSRSGSSVSGQFRSAQIADAKRRHKAAAASTSVTVGKPKTRSRVFYGLRESSLTKFLTVAAFAVVGIVGLVLIFIAANSGGNRTDAVKADTGEETVDVTEPTTTGAAQTAPAVSVDDDGASVTVTLGGAVRLQDEILSAARSGSGYNFSNYLDEMKLIMDSEISVVGLSGYIDGDGGDKNLAGYAGGANYPRQLAQALSEMGVNTVAAANSSSMAGSFDRLSNTVSNLSEQNITTLGTFQTQGAKENVCVKKIDGICVGIGSYNCITSSEIAAQNGSFTDEQKAWCINQYDITSASEFILKDVETMRAAGAKFIVVYLNWGNASDTAPTAEMRSLAQDLIDAGVDVTAGVGSNFVEKITVKTSKTTNRQCYVFYGLGNIFTDIASGESQSTQQSLVVSFTLNRAANSDTVSLAKMNYYPVFCNRDATHASENTYLKYRVVPASRYVDASALPSVFSTNDQWQRCKTTFTNIRTLVGDKLVLGDVEKVDSVTGDGAGGGENASL